MQIRIGICEDEEVICEDVKRKIQELRENYIIDTYSTGEKLLLAELNYDIVFLDIELPGKNGLKVAWELRNRKYNGHIIFLTSHTEFMQDAFKVKAFRFLEKPIKKSDLEETIMESEKEILMNKKMIITDYGAEILIHLSDILYIESNKNKTIIHTLNDKLETKYTLKYWLEELENAYFFQVHKSYIVSLRHIEAFDIDYVKLHGTNSKVPVSRRNASAVKKAFFDYVKTNGRCM